MGREWRWDAKRGGQGWAKRLLLSTRRGLAVAVLLLAPEGIVLCTSPYGSEEEDYS